MVQIGFTTDIAAAEDAAGTYLMADPVAHNLTLTLLTAHREVVQAAPDYTTGPSDVTPPTVEELRFWWGSTGEAATGICFQIGSHPCVVAAGDRATAASLAGAVAGTVTHLPGVNGEIAAATAFVAEWAAALHLTVRPGLVQTYYVFEGPGPHGWPDPGASAATESGLTPAPATGALRLARLDELDLLINWSVGFERDVFGRHQVDLPAVSASVRAQIERDQLWVWVTTAHPVAMTAASPILGGVTRIRGVYTPPELRGAGYAAACVAGVVADRLAAGATHCALYADLANPTSNGVYRRLGFRPHSAHIAYVFN